MERLTEQEFTESLIAVLGGVGLMSGEEACDLTDLPPDEVEPLRGMEAADFRRDAVMTSNEGLTVRLANGQQFQLTVVRSR